MQKDKTANNPLDDIDRVLVDEPTIKARLAELGEEINVRYEGRDLAVIAIINGAIIFVADLIRELSIPIQLDCIRVSSYRDDTKPVQAPEVIDKGDRCADYRRHPRFGKHTVKGHQYVSCDGTGIAQDLCPA